MIIKLASFFFPLSNLDEAFALLYLSLSSTEKNFHESVAKSLNNLFHKNLDSMDIKNLISKYKMLFNFDLESFKETFEKLKEIKKTYLKITKNCLSCFIPLSHSNTSNVVNFNLRKASLSSTEQYQCLRCQRLYFSDYIMNKNENKFFYPKEIKTDYVQTSSKTSFHKDILQVFDSHLIRNGVSMDGFCEIYNALNPSNSLKRGLDRRRLSEGWFIYKLRFYMHIDDVFLNKYFQLKSIEQFLEVNFENLKNYIVKFWFDNHKRVIKI